MSEPLSERMRQAYVRGRRAEVLMGPTSATLQTNWIRPGNVMAWADEVAQLENDVGWYEQENQALREVVELARKFVDYERRYAYFITSFKRLDDALRDLDREVSRA